MRRKFFVKRTSYIGRHVYQHGWSLRCMLVLCKASRARYSTKYFNRTYNNDCIVQLVKRVLNVTAILIHDTLQTTSPFIDVVINEALAVVVRAIETC